MTTFIRRLTKAPEGSFDYPLFSPLPQVKVFQQGSGFCFVTFSEHSAPVTAVQFLPSGHALVSASLDGTVRAYDLVR